MPLPAIVLLMVYGAVLTDCLVHRRFLLFIVLGGFAAYAVATWPSFFTTGA